jgi:hypothetical protein
VNLGKVMTIAAMHERRVSGSLHELSVIRQWSGCGGRKQVRNGTFQVAYRCNLYVLQVPACDARFGRMQDSTALTAFFYAKFRFGIAKTIRKKGQ